MKTTLSLAVTILLTSTAMAQERTAAGAMDTQMTWTALSAKVQSANDKADAVNVRVDQVVVCGKKGMVYAPGATGADSQGCFQSATAPGVITSLTTIQSSVSNVVTCNKAGQVFDGTKCIASVQGKPTTDASRQYRVVSGRGDGWVPKSCADGYVMVGGYWTDSDNWAMDCRPLVLR